MSSIIYQPKSVTSETDPILYLFIINARHLSIRRDKIKEVVKQIANVYKYRVIPKFITINDPSDIEPLMATLKDRIAYEKCGDQDFDNLLHVLNIEEVSNIFKHNEVWSQINNGVYNTNDLFLVIEDDAMLLQQSIKEFREVFEYVCIPNNNTEWDILFPCLSQPNNTQNIEVTPLANTFKVLPSKESYFINKHTASRLLQLFNENKITHRFRFQLSKYLFMNKDLVGRIKSMIINRRCTIDGSKIGFFPTTVSNNNVLVYNGEYMELFNIFHRSSTEEIKQKLNRIKEIYNLTKHLNSPDITHLYGALLMRLEKYDEAEDILKYAFELTRQSQGLLNNRCDLANNIINIYSKLQNDIAVISKNPSKYANYDIIPLKD